MWQDNSLPEERKFSPLFLALTNKTQNVSLKSGTLALTIISSTLFPHTASTSLVCPSEGSQTETLVSDFETPILQQIYGFNDLPPLLSSVLPPSYTYRFKEFSSISNSSNPVFSLRVMINVVDEYAVNKWLKEFENHNSTTYRVTRGSKFKGKLVLYKTERRFQHKWKLQKNAKPAKKECLKLRDKKRNKLLI